MHKHLFFYSCLLLVFGIGIFSILGFGSRLQVDQPLPAAANSASALPAAAPAAGALGSLLENIQHPLGILLLQMIAIVLIAQLLGSLFRRVGQPAVIGEMLAGILLGPSVLGSAFPAGESFLFPTASLDTLKLLSQLGVVLFMFVVGTELDLRSLSRQANAAVMISHASILLPFFLGSAFSLLIYPSLGLPGISFQIFALFIGIAMSITAFPVLARIIEERGLSQSRLGNTAIACAAVDDVTAWCILAVVVALTKAQNLAGALLTLILALVFIGSMLWLVKPQIARLLKTADGERQGKGVVAAILAFVFACAWFTDLIGIHELFGAFLAGVAMPAHKDLRKFLKEHLGAFSSVFLLPLFFAFTGLRTQIGLLNDWQSWLTCAGIILIAILGKFGGSLLAARWTGMDWHDSAAIGALMNTRGLMELIVLNLGYDLGVLSPRFFSMLVLMALVTTLMTGPLLSLIQSLKPGALQAENIAAD